MKAYKGFNRNMTCRDFQFEEGKEYEQDGEIKVCKNGFHACERPLDCFDYYNPSESVYHEVELEGDISKSGDDTKVAAKKIKVGARLNIAGLVKAQFEYVKTHTTTEDTDPKKANAGDRGAAISRGSASVGTDGVAIARGEASYGCKVKGGMGSILILVCEEDESYDIAEWKAVVVDGEKIKPDTWYELKDGEVVEVK